MIDGRRRSPCPPHGQDKPPPPPSILVMPERRRRDGCARVHGCLSVSGRSRSDEWGIASIDVLKSFFLKILTIGITPQVYECIGNSWPAQRLNSYLSGFASAVEVRGWCVVVDLADEETVTWSCRTNSATVNDWWTGLDASAADAHGRRRVCSKI